MDTDNGANAMRSLRPKNPNNGNVVVLFATQNECDALIEAVEAALRDPVNPTHRDTNEYSNLHVDLVQARYGNRTHAKKST